VAMIALSLGLEVAYRAASKRQIHLGRRSAGNTDLHR
jgi:tRNA threonylcarbamoyladenosine modification (KEOPS) complex Cgi121 subunit